MIQHRKSEDWVTRVEFLKVSDKHDKRSSDLEKRMDGLEIKMDGLDKKINNLALQVFNIDSRLMRVEETMATKEDINRIINLIDAFTYKLETYDRSAVIAEYLRKEAAAKIQDHGKCLA